MTPNADNVTAIVSRDPDAALILAIKLRRLGFVTETYVSASTKGYKKAVAKAMQHELAILLDEDVAIDAIYDERYDLTQVDVVSLVVENMGDIPRPKLWVH
jgi:hypothetical protein